MKKIVSLIIILPILLGSFSKSVIYLHYITNKDFYANVLCENKTKPKMQCHGKCRMMKELKKDEKRESVPVSNSKDKTELVYFYESQSASIYSVADLIVNHFYFHEPTTTDYTTTVFHPPCC